MEQNNTNIQTAPDYSSETAIMLGFSRLNVISSLHLFAGIHSTTKLKTYEKAKKSFNPANTQSSY